MKKPFLIALVGLVGSGKSVVAKELARVTKAKIIQTDTIRVELRRHNKSFDATERLLLDRAQAALQRRTSVIVDADTRRASTRKKLLSEAKRAGCRVFFIRIIADPDIMLGRITNARYTSGDLFGGASTTWPGNANARGKIVKTREMWRRTPHHYRWDPKNGGRWRLKPLSFPLFATIDTSDPKHFKKRIRDIAKRLR